MRTTLAGDGNPARPMTAAADLAAIDLFAGLGDEARAAAVDGLRATRIAVGQEFHVTVGALCCVVAGGRLALAVIADERERTIGILEQGDLLVRPTESWAASQPQVRCFAIEDAVVYPVDGPRMAAWMREPALAAALVHVLSTQIAERELAVAIALEPRVERRLLLKLRQLAERWGRVTPEGIRLDLRLTHQELANMVGAVRESVTIALGRLAEAGEIEIRKRTLIITRPPDWGGRARPAANLVGTPGLAERSGRRSSTTVRSSAPSSAPRRPLPPPASGSSWHTPDRFGARA